MRIHQLERSNSENLYCVIFSDEEEMNEIQKDAMIQAHDEGVWVTCQGCMNGVISFHFNGYEQHIDAVEQYYLQCASTTN